MDIRRGVKNQKAGYFKLSKAAIKITKNEKKSLICLGK